MNCLDKVLQLNNIIVDTLDAQADSNYEKKGITADNASERYFYENKPFFYFEEYPKNQKILSDVLIRKR